METTNSQGSWGGKGTNKKSKKNPKFLIKTAGIEPALRKDFTTSNVIITEKKDRKASQFQVKDLPYPYTSIEQFEARFKTPIGSEWNSRGVHQKETMPRVVKKVCPLRFPFLSFFPSLSFLFPLFFSTSESFSLFSFLLSWSFLHPTSSGQRLTASLEQLSSLSEDYSSTHILLNLHVNICCISCPLCITWHLTTYSDSALHRSEHE